MSRKCYAINVGLQMELMLIDRDLSTRNEPKKVVGSIIWKTKVDLVRYEKKWKHWEGTILNSVKLSSANSQRSVETKPEFPRSTPAYYTISTMSTPKNSNIFFNILTMNNK